MEGITIDELTKASTQANQDLRVLKKQYEVYPERCDIMYGLYVLIDDIFHIKIGRTTLAGFYRRMKEHSSTWSSNKITLISVKKIVHWTEEEKFHKHMKKYKNGIYKKNVKNRKKSFDEFYCNDKDVLDEFYRFIG